MNDRAAGLGRCLASNRLNLILMPTERCNFRCTYCYEDFARGRMGPAVVRGIKNLLARRAPELDVLSLAWFGGEPLLAADIVEDIQSHALSLALQHPRMSFLGSMTTNAFLLDRKRWARLLDLGVRWYQVSLDGPRDLHDRKRVTAAGHGTFDRIWRNLLAARDLDGEFEIVVRVHVDRENLEAIPGLLERCREAFGNDPRFRIFVRPLSRLGGPGDGKLGVLAPEQEGKIMMRIRRDAGALGLRQYRPEAEGGQACYAAAANSFVVRADGTLGKCTVALSHPENQVGRLHEDGRMDLDVTKMKRWMRGLWSGDAQELGCPKRGYADAIPVSLAAR